MKKALLIAMLVSQLGCALCREPEPPCDLVVLGACVSVGNAEVDASIVDRIEWAITAGANFWGADPNSVLRGYSIILSKEPPSFCFDGTVAACVSGDCPHIYLSEMSLYCYEAFLPHEIGHVVIGDSAHTDPRWRSEPMECMPAR